MALTPADVHNVAFSRPRIGKRGYDEQEVDLFIDLVEQELLRHIAEDTRLRNLYAELRDRGPDQIGRGRPGGRIGSAIVRLSADNPPATRLHTRRNV
ncbi:hypothetical protein MHEI_25480 [Mycobacterium heidelbergense]|nr:hypothetical protein MHEI_25480 [Mycobacterium heidelbergense]